MKFTKRMIMITSFLGALTAPSAWAAVTQPYVIDFELTITDEKPESARIILGEGQTASLELNGVEFTVTPRSLGQEKVELNMEIAHDMGGWRDVVGAPRMLALLGHSAEGSQGSADGQPGYRYRVIARKGEQPHPNRQFNL